VGHFLDEAALALGKKKPTVPRELFDLLAAYHFPGNVRELKAMIFDAVSQHKSHVLSMRVLKDRIAGEAPVSSRARGAAGREEASIYSNLSKLPALKDATDLLIAEALQRSKGNISAAAEILGISHQALSKRLKRRSEM
jgi:DNA-binding NtrC family response regulator